MSAATAASLPKLDLHPIQFALEPRSEANNSTSSDNWMSNESEKTCNEIHPFSPEVMVPSGSLVLPPFVQAERLLDGNCDEAEDVVREITREKNFAVVGLSEDLELSRETTPEISTGFPNPFSVTESNSDQEQFSSPSSLPPCSPYESLRPLTPPFPDDIDVQQLHQNTSRSLLTESTAIDFDELTRPTLSERRCHSSVALETTDGTDSLLPPEHFPELRRYSLVDSGPRNSSTVGRRTIYDIDQNASLPSLRTSPRVFPYMVNSNSHSTSHPASRPFSARFSTFAEMGIQSFAMAKGGKTVDPAKRSRKDSSVNDAKKTMLSGAGSSLKSSLRDESPDMQSCADVERQVLDNVDDSMQQPEEADAFEKAEGVKRKRRHVISKMADCVIM